MWKARLLIASLCLGVVPGLLAQPPGGAGASTGPKVCVTEMKPTAKVVHGSECKEYCLPRSCVVVLVRSWFGVGGCADGDCGEVRTKQVLLKKSVPGPDAPKCVLKDLAACGPATPLGPPPQPR